MMMMMMIIQIKLIKLKDEIKGIIEEILEEN